MLSQADSNLVRRQPMIPGLATLFDRDAFLSTLQRCTSNVTIHDGRAIYLRFKPGTNCLVSYAVDTSIGRLQVYGKAFAIGTKNKGYKHSQPGQIRGWLGFDAALLPSQQITLFSFPCDYQLQALPQLLGRAHSTTLSPTVSEESATQHLLASLLPDQPELWSGQVVPLHYKPERRFVGQLVAGEQRALLKLYHKSEADNAATAAQHIRSRGGLRVAKQLGVCPQQRVMALEWLLGEPLESAWLQSDSATQTRLAQQIGVALAQVHAQPIELPLHYDRASEASAVAATAQSLTAITPEYAELATRLAQLIGQRLLDSPVRTTLIHGDFKPDQLLLQPDGGIALLDFDCAGQGDAMSDLGSFAAELQRRAAVGTLDDGVAQRWMAQVQQGYCAVAGQRFDADNYQTQVAARLYRLAVAPFRTYVENWDRQVVSILLRVEQWLDKKEILA